MYTLFLDNERALRFEDEEETIFNVCQTVDFNSVGQEKNLTNLCLYL